jgi:hypothetical protein
MSEQTCDELEQALSRLKTIEKSLPATYFSDRTLEFRVQKLVQEWRKLIGLNQEFSAAEKWFVKTGTSFWELDTVTQRKLIEDEK